MLNEKGVYELCPRCGADQPLGLVSLMDGITMICETCKEEEIVLKKTGELGSQTHIYSEAVK